MQSVLGGRIWRVLATVALLGVSVVLGPAWAQAEPNFRCRDVLAYFARGTGQTTASSREAGSFFSEIENRLDLTQIDYQPVQAGDGDGYKGHRYRADGGVGDMFDAWNEVHNFGDETLGVYYHSVNDGVAEVLPYLNDRAAECPDEQWILGGYSQGAHMLGNVLRHSSLSAAAKDNVAFVTFFGDPKLLLNGRGGLLTAPGCRGAQYQWVRGSVACWSDGGVLVPANPYVPPELQDRIGSWCDHFDGICAGNEARIVLKKLMPAHSEYPDGEIPEAAIEAVSHLKQRLRDVPASAFNIRHLPVSTGTNGIDVAIVMDTTGSMGGVIDSARASARSIGDAVVALPGGRVSLVQYKDHPDQGDPFAARAEVPFTTNVDDLQAGLDGLVATGGGDGPEAVYSGLMTAFNEMSWASGATKVAIVIADIGGKDPEPVTGYTLDQVLARARELDPVAVYPLLSYDSPDPFFDALADGSAGKVLPFNGDAGGALLEALELIKFQPIAVLGGPYFGEPGHTVTLHADGSYDPNADIVKYEWDFEADGTVDETTTDPAASHAYADAFTGQALVAVTSADGGIAQGTAEVTIATEPLAAVVLGAPRSVEATVGEDGVATVRWLAPPGDAEISGYLVAPSATAEGSGAGNIVVEATEARLTNLPPGATVNFTVWAVGDAGRGHPAASNAVVVPGAVAPPTTASVPGGCETGSTGCSTSSTASSARSDGDALPASSDRGGRLPFTGATLVPAVVVALILIGGGVALLRARRAADSL